MTVANEYLRNVGPGTCASVGHVERDADLVRRRSRNRQILVRKGCVGQSVAEGEQRLGCGLVEVAIADENSFASFNFLPAIFRIVTVMHRIVFPAAFDRNWQAS